MKGRDQRLEFEHSTSWQPPALKSQVVRSFFGKENVHVLLHSPDFFLFPKLAKQLSGRRYASRNDLGSTIISTWIPFPKTNHMNAFKAWKIGWNLYVCLLKENNLKVITTKNIFLSYFCSNDDIIYWTPLLFWIKITLC